MKQIKMVSVAIAKDEAYPVYPFQRGKTDTWYCVGIQVSEDVIKRWEATQKAYDEMTKELESFYEKDNK